MALAKCTNCNRTIPNGHAKCWNCGADIAEVKKIHAFQLPSLKLIIAPVLVLLIVWLGWWMTNRSKYSDCVQAAKALEDLHDDISFEVSLISNSLGSSSMGERATNLRELSKKTQRLQVPDCAQEAKHMLEGFAKQTEDIALDASRLSAGPDLVSEIGMIRLKLGTAETYKEFLAIEMSKLKAAYSP